MDKFYVYYTKAGEPQVRYTYNDVSKFEVAVRQMRELYSKRSGVDQVWVEQSAMYGNNKGGVVAKLGIEFPMGEL